MKANHQIANPVHSIHDGGSALHHSDECCVPSPGTGTGVQQVLRRDLCGRSARHAQSSTLHELLTSRRSLCPALSLLVLGVRLCSEALPCHGGVPPVHPKVNVCNADCSCHHAYNTVLHKHDCHHLPVAMQLASKACLASLTHARDVLVEASLGFKRLKRGCLPGLHNPIPKNHSLSAQK